MEFEIKGFLKPDGTWGIHAVVPDGQTVMGGDVASILLRGAAWYDAHKGDRVFTVSEMEAAAKREPEPVPATPEA
jgi:hypothetical protein